MNKLLVDVLKVLPEWRLINRDRRIDAVAIQSVTNDSREVIKGSLFLAFPGTLVDGRDFIEKAMENGAVAICYEAAGDTYLPESDIPFISVLGLKKHQAALAEQFYDYPSAKLSVVGITGTNGKTSCTYFLAEALSGNKKCGVIGTTGFGFLPFLKKGLNTTPDAIRLQQAFLELYDAGAAVVAVEASSHGLVEGRLSGVAFETAVFTNLSPEHLDFHGSMENYKAAKALLFEWPGLKNAVINADDVVGQEYIQRYQHHLHVLSYSCHLSANADIFLKKLSSKSNGFAVTLSTPWGEGDVFIPLLGVFNLSNVLAVVGVLGLQGVSFETILNKVSQLQNPPGRMALYHSPGKPTVVVDFAHTPDALENVLKALRTQCQGQLWCVFGCGGNRDSKKRPMMGAIAERYADQVVITNDNPRFESPQKIAGDVCAGMSVPEKRFVVLDREKAIQMAIARADANDLVLVAGKGHETEQIEGDQIIPFNDGVVVESCLSAI